MVANNKHLEAVAIRVGASNGTDERQSLIWADKSNRKSHLENAITSQNPPESHKSSPPNCHAEEDEGEGEEYELNYDYDNGCDYEYDDDFIYQKPRRQLINGDGIKKVLASMGLSAQNKQRVEHAMNGNWLFNRVPQQPNDINDSYSDIINRDYIDNEEDELTDNNRDNHAHQFQNGDKTTMSTEQRRKRNQPKDYLNNLPPSSNSHHSPIKQHLSTSKAQYRCRSLITLLVLLTLLVSSIFVLNRLVQLVHDADNWKQNHNLTTNINFRQSTMASSSIGSLIAKGKERPSSKMISEDADDDDKYSSRWIVAAPKCRIPNMNAWDDSIRDYIKLEPGFNCSKIVQENAKDRRPDIALTIVQDNRLQFNPKAVARLGVDKRDCCYKGITRSEENDDDLVYSDTCTPVGDEILIDAPQLELIQVECPRFNYTNVHSFVVHNLEEEEALKRVAEKKLIPNQYYNVILLGVDTISRLNGLRQLNETLSVLTDKYRALQYYGYNKVGENTFPNLIPLLTGMSPEQLTETQCWMASNYSQETETGDDFLDNCKYLWNFYQALGYATYFSEDWPKASTFNYLKQGFRHQPTTEYGRPFTIARDDLLLPLDTTISCTPICLYDKPLVELDIGNLKTFIREHQSMPHFAFHWINCPQHDDLNGSSRTDKLLADFFRFIHEITDRSRTFVIFFSDHGYRWNNFVSTRIGHYESNLPMLTIAPPKHFVENHPKLYENLKRHQSALITPFDMFKTLVSIRNLGKQAEQPQQKKPHKSARRQKSRGHTRPLTERAALVSSSPKPTKSGFKVSTFETIDFGPTARTTVKQIEVLNGLTYRQKFRTISLLDYHNASQIDRSCIEAGIPDNYCVCHQFEEIESDGMDSMGAAIYLVYVHLYGMIKDHRKLCHSLDLEQIHHAEAFDFSRMLVRIQKPDKRRRRQTTEEDNLHQNKEKIVTLKTTHRPVVGIDKAVFVQGEGQMATDGSQEYGQGLPNMEFNIKFSTRPGSALFQEVVRFYGSNLTVCKLEVAKVRHEIEMSNDTLEKHNLAIRMNQVCRFSVHSESLSRLNIYRDQSACVKNNPEVKKVCYCNDLIKPQ